MALAAKIEANLTSDTYVKLAISISVPLIIYVLLLVITKKYR